VENKLSEEVKKVGDGGKKVANMLISIRKSARICLGAYYGKKQLPSPEKQVPIRKVRRSLRTLSVRGCSIPSTSPSSDN
jgi:hypothetical protein